MSLLIHLPLEGNLNNLGTANIITTLEGVASYVDDGPNKNNTCFQYTGSNGIRIETNTTVPTNATMTFWYKTPSDVSRGPYCSYIDENQEYTTRTDFGMPAYTGLDWDEVYFAVYSYYKNKTYRLIKQLRQWTHIALVKINNRLQVYFNGLLILDFTKTGNLPILNQTQIGIGFGYYHAALNFSNAGLISNFKLYDTSLNQEEIFQAANEYSGLTNLILHYTCETNNFTIMNSINTAYLPDSSGYRNIGIINNYDQVSFNTPSPKYNQSMLLSKNDPSDVSCYIKSNLQLTNPNNLTIAWWENPVSSNDARTSAFATTTSTTFPTTYNNTTIHHTSNQFFLCTSNNQIISISSPITTGWHHYAITYSGLTTTIYRDGIVYATNNNASLSSLKSCTSLFIGLAGDTTNTLQAINASYSDFRVYNKVLTQREIQFLYQRGMSISSDTISANKIIENNNVLKFYKSGVLECNALDEDSSNILNTNLIYNKIIEY